jgi:RimJ/RimL family protein N-acetyltransferase
MDFSGINIRKITTDDRDTDFIVSLRNDLEVRKRFFSAEAVTRESHLKYLAKATACGDMIFIIEKNNEPVGQVAYLNIDTKKKELEGGAFVIRPEIKGLGIGAFVEYNMVDFAFNVLGVNRIYARVLHDNAETFKLHKNFGFKEEKRSRGRMMINGKKSDVFHLGILKSEWDKERFKKLFGERVFNG